MVCGGRRENTLSNSYNNFLLMMLDSLGNVVWQNNYANSGGNYWETAWSVVETPTNGFMAVGLSSRGNFDIYLVETDSRGLMLWDTIIGTGGYEGIGEIALTSDNGYLLSGFYRPQGGSSSITVGLILMLDSAHHVVWSKTYGSMTKYEGFGANIASLADGSAVLPGQSMDDQGDPVGWILKI